MKPWMMQAFHEGCALSEKTKGREATAEEKEEFFNWAQNLLLRLECPEDQISFHAFVFLRFSLIKPEQLRAALEDGIKSALGN